MVSMDIRLKGVDPELSRRIKIIALERNTTQTELIIALIEDCIKDDAKRKAKGGSRANLR